MSTGTLWTTTSTVNRLFSKGVLLYHVQYLLFAILSFYTGRSVALSPYPFVKFAQRCTLHYNIQDMFPKIATGQQTHWKGGVKSSREQHQRKDRKKKKRIKRGKIHRRDVTDC